MTKVNDSSEFSAVISDCHQTKHRYRQKPIQMVIKHEHYNVSCFHTTIYIDIIAQLQTRTSLINQIQMLLSLCTYSSMKLVVM